MPESDAGLTVLVSGLGLMGASAAAAAQAAGHRVFLHHRRLDPIRQAVERGFGEAWSGEEDLDLVVIGAPVEAVAGVVADLAPRTGAAVLCDMGSTKAGVCAAIEARGLDRRFLGAHPMCGSHHQGLAHADPSMFQGASCVLTPGAETDAGHITLAENFWRSLGCTMHQLSPEEHDAAVARASHVPHILAAATARQLRGSAVALAAGGFRDTSRVAAGDPELWRGILESNKDEVLEVLEEVLDDLNLLIGDLRRGSEDGVLEYLLTARDRRGLFEAVRLAALRERAGNVSYFSSGLADPTPDVDEL